MIEEWHKSAEYSYIFSSPAEQISNKMELGLGKKQSLM
jgi:hypothetical protein